MKIKTDTGTVMTLQGDNFISEDSAQTVLKEKMMELIHEGKAEIVGNPTTNPHVLDELELPESIKNKIQIMFDESVQTKIETLETSYKAKLDEVIAKQKDNEILDETYVEKLEEVKAHLETEYKEQYEQVTETLDVYLNDLHQEWKTENTVELQNKTLIENARYIVDELQRTLTTVSIDLPTDKVSMYEEEKAKVSVLEKEMSDMLAERIELKKSVETMQKDIITAKLSENLVMADAIKLVELCAEIEEYSDLDDFENKAEMLKTKYFTGSTPSLIETDKPADKKRSPTVSTDIAGFVASLNK
jgi:hypothetical protein